MVSKKQSPVKKLEKSAFVPTSVKKSEASPIAPKVEASVKKPAASPIAPKAEVSAKKSPASPVVSKEETNLKKLAESPLIMNFVKRKNGTWNHQDWLDFLSDIKTHGCDPIDPDKVGLLLEEKKTIYLASKNA